jgi:hypothetical protein
VQAICASRFVYYQNLVGFGNYFMPLGLPHLPYVLRDATGKSSLGCGTAARFRNSLICFCANGVQITPGRLAPLVYGFHRFCRPIPASVG